MEHGKNSENISIPDAVIYKTSSSVMINRKKGFLSLGLCEVNSGLKKVQNIIYSSLEFSGRKEELLKEFEDYLTENNLSGLIAGSSNALTTDELIIKSNNDLTIYLGLPAIVQNRIKFTANLEKLKESLEKSFSPMDMILFINKSLTEDMLLSCFKTAVETKNMALENAGIPLNSRKAILEGNSKLGNSKPGSPKETLIIACPLEEDMHELNDQEINELLNSIAAFVDENCQEAFKEANLSLGILDYIYQQGISIDDLADAGLELCVGVEVTPALRDKLKNQILKSLEDLNVIALIMAAIRVEDDFQNHRLREVNVDDDPAYLYTDEVLGMAIANQIAGTKAIFNFKRYDEEKPGIISTLGPMVDDIFAGLVAGCMSKIFEE